MNLLSQLAMYNSDYMYTYNSPTDAALAPAVVGIVLSVVFITLAVIYAVHAFLLSRIFKKAGISQSIAWVPFYNTWKLLEMGDQQGFWAILAIIPLINYAAAVFLYIAMYKIGLKFGKDGVWVVLAIFFPTIWMAILAFDGSKWRPKTIKS